MPFIHLCAHSRIDGSDGLVEQGNQLRIFLLHCNGELIYILSITGHFHCIGKTKSGKVMICDQKILHITENLTFLHHTKPFFHRVHTNEFQCRIITTHPLRSHIPVDYGNLAAIQFSKAADIPCLVLGDEDQRNSDIGFCKQQGSPARIGSRDGSCHIYLSIKQLCISLLPRKVLHDFKLQSGQGCQHIKILF